MDGDPYLEIESKYILYLFSKLPNDVLSMNESCLGHSTFYVYDGLGVTFDFTLILLNWWWVKKNLYLTGLLSAVLYCREYIRAAPII